MSGLPPSKISFANAYGELVVEQISGAEVEDCGVYIPLSETQRNDLGCYGLCLIMKDSISAVFERFLRQGVNQRRVVPSGRNIVCRSLIDLMVQRKIMIYRLVDQVVTPVNYHLAERIHTESEAYRGLQGYSGFQILVAVTSEIHRRINLNQTAALQNLT